jgi:patatin-like phospholipase/acyl hydrolase
MTDIVEDWGHIVPSGPKPGPQYIRILSLDGGGFRGIVSLLILDSLMHKLLADGAFPGPEVPKPCEVFDLIVGTSTGGLMALLLGRLELSAKQALDAYLDLGVKVFGHDGGTFWWAATGNPRFDSQVIEKYIKDKGWNLKLVSDKPLKSRVSYEAAV